MSLLLPNGQQQFCDGNGVPLAAGLVYMFTVGTTTLATTYSDYLLTQPNTNPIVLDGNGRCTIWGVGAFQQLVTDQFGNQIWNTVTSDGSINPAGQYAPISGSPYYAPASGSPNYAPISGSAFYAPSGGNASEPFLVAPGSLGNNALTITQYQQGNNAYSYDTGTVNAIIATFTPAIATLVDGMLLRIRVAFTNTSVASINVNGLGASPIILQTGSALSGGEMEGGKTSIFCWNAADSEWQLLNPINTGSGTAQSWNNVTGARAINVTYTNNFGEQIQVSATASFTASGGEALLTAVVNGLPICAQTSYVNGTNATVNVVFNVPAGNVYQVNGSITSGSVNGAFSWYELR